MNRTGDTHSLPIVLRLAGRPVVLVGEGAVADAQRRILERAGAQIVAEGSKAALAIVVDDVAAVSRLKVRGVLVCAIDRPDLSDFTFATGGRKPVAARTGSSAGAGPRRGFGALLAPLAGTINAIARLLPNRRRDRVALDLALAKGGPLEQLAGEDQPGIGGPDAVGREAGGAPADRQPGRG